MKLAAYLTSIFLLVFLTGYSQLNNPGQAILKLTVSENGEITVTPLQQQPQPEIQCNTIKPLVQKNNNYSDKLKAEAISGNFMNQDYYKEQKIRSTNINNGFSTLSNSEVKGYKTGIFESDR